MNGAVWNELEHWIPMAGEDAKHFTPVLPIQIRSHVGDDIRYCIGSWAEEFKFSPDAGRMPWRLYKRHVRPELERKLRRDDTHLLAAYLGTDIVGWLAYVPGRRVSTVHWVHTRYCIGDGGECLRKRGVMVTLLDAAQLGDRIVYTHRGPVPKHRGTGKQTSDQWIAAWLRKRGVSATYLPYEEWSA